MNVSSFDYITSGTYANHGLGSSLGAPTTALNGTIELGDGGKRANVNLNYTGTGETTDRVINVGLNSSSSQQITQSGTGLLKFTSNLTGSGASTPSGGLILDGSASGTGEISGNIPNFYAGAKLTKSGSGTWTLSGTNAYTGVTTITGGTLSVSTLADAGSNSNLGAFAAAGAGGISLNGGTLQYTGSTGVSVNRGFTLAASSTVNVNPASTALTLGASSLGAFTLNVTGGSGSSLALGALTLTGAAALNPTSANLTVASIGGTQNLTLRGTSTGNSVTGAIATGTGTLTKSGTGTWVLKGANSNTGATGISGGGTLVLDYGSGQDNSKIGNAALTLQGGSLVLRGGSHAQAVTTINFYS